MMLLRNPIKHAGKVGDVGKHFLAHRRALFWLADIDVEEVDDVAEEVC